MVLKKGNPGCPCCDDDCRIEITGWNVILPSGDSAWDLSNPTSITTEDSSGLAVTTNAHPEAKSTHVVIVRVRGEDDGDILRVVIAYDDADNYLFGEIEVGNDCGYIRLFEVVAGDVFQLGIDYPVLNLKPESEHYMQLCYDGEELTLTIHRGAPPWYGGSGEFSTIKASYSQEVTASGTRVGVATGAIHALATFTGFQWWEHYDDGGYYEEPNDCPMCLTPDGCIIYEDDFSRTQDEGTALCVWRSVSGDWEIDGGKLWNISESGTIILDRPIDDGDYAQYAEFVFNLNMLEGIAREKVRLLIDSNADGTDKHYFEYDPVGELTFNIRLKKNDTVLAEILNADPGQMSTQPWRVKLSITDTLFEAVVLMATSPNTVRFVLGAQTTRLGHQYIGIETLLFWDPEVYVDGEVRPVTVDYVKFSYHDDDFEECPGGGFCDEFVEVLYRDCPE